MKSISTINLVIKETTECWIKARASFIDLKVGVSLNHGVLLRFVLLLPFRTCWETFQAKNNVRSAPASSALTLVSHRSHNACIANCHLSGSELRNGAQKRTKVSFGRTMMQALELLRLYVSRWSNVEQWRNQTCSFSHYWVTLPWRP